MNQRSTFLIEILEKLGTPLLAAVQGVAGNQKTPGDPVDDAKTMAALLAKSVQVSITVAGAMDLKDEDGDADAIRLALAALAGPLVADAYRSHGKVPQDADVTRMTKSLEAVLAFSNNFTSSSEYVGRLKSLGGGAPFFDAIQSHLHTLHALVPVINAISEFPFGQPENKLVQDVAARLGQQAEAIRKELVGDVAEDQAKFSELMILRSLAEIYTECHRAETARLSANDDESREGGLSLDPVWEAFDTRAAMLTTVVNMAVPGQASSGAAAPVPTSAPPQQQTPVQPAAAEAPAAPPAAENPPDPGNPMGFFAQKQVKSRADEVSPEPPPAAQPEAPAAPQAPAQPAQTPPSDGNPMAFFKPGAKTSGEDTGGETGGGNQ